MADDKDITTAAAPAKLGEVFEAYVVDLQGQARHPAWTVAPGSGSDTVEETQRLLQEWLTTVAARATPGAAARVHWTSALPQTIRPTELYTYLCPTSKSRFGKKRADAQVASGHSGATQLHQDRKLGDRVLCEVWPDAIPHGASPRALSVILAKLVFHEWLHFKLDIDPGADDVVHGLGNFGEPRLDNQPPHAPSEAVVAPLAEALHKEYRFYR